MRVEVLRAIQKKGVWNRSDMRYLRADCRRGEWIAAKQRADYEMRAPPPEELRYSQKFRTGDNNQSFGFIAQPIGKFRCKSGSDSKHYVLS
jgi:hypothetical protein